MSGDSKAVRSCSGATWLALIALSSACDFDDPEPVAKRDTGLTVAAVNRTTTLAASSATSSPTPAPTATLPQPHALNSAEQARAACPENMVEVQGLYCEVVVHHCINGGRDHLGEPDGEPEPFYCDVYQADFAKCYGKQEPKHFCIDEFEYPNRLGAIPMVMVTWYEARRLCETQGKRLCGDDEWTLACEGPQHLPYPYGFARDPTACNIDHLWMAPNDDLLANRAAPPAEIQAEIDRLSKRVPSGSMPRCKSPYGVMDMTGNVDEWAVNVTLDGKPFHSVFKGGHWVSGARNRCRPVTASHDENTAYYAEGFRCCAPAG